ncbi:MAG: metallophosphoesterase family protein [Limisphaerales bacterium]
MKIGVISDTHGFWDPRIPELFSGVDHILHAGDIGLPEIILELERIAPVTAVLGNTDVGLTFRETEIVRLDGRKFLIHHIVDVRAPSETVQRLLAGEQPDIVVFGHTHKPFSEQRGRTRFFNPGYAGKPRFGLARSIALLHSAAAGLCAEHVAL